MCCRHTAAFPASRVSRGPRQAHQHLPTDVTLRDRDRGQKERERTLSDDDLMNPVRRSNANSSTAGMRCRLGVKLYTLLRGS
jgi:hypothetical protein